MLAQEADTGRQRQTRSSPVRHYWQVDTKKLQMKPQKQNYLPYNTLKGGKKGESSKRTRESLHMLSSSIGQ